MEENMSNLTSASGDQTSVCDLLTDQEPPKKKRNLPGNPDPDAEVITLSPKTLMATNRFKCEICNKGFQREQNLQLHRRGHNLPWKLKQRHSKEVTRKKVYVCPEASCVHHDPSRALGDLTGIKKHFCRKHGEKKWKCEKCTKCYAVQSDWKAHSKICGTREYRCDCGTLFSRRDSFITHRAFCDALAEESAKSIATGNIHHSLLHSSPGTTTTEGCTSKVQPPPPHILNTNILTYDQKEQQSFSIGPMNQGPQSQKPMIHHHHFNVNQNPNPGPAGLGGPMHIPASLMSSTTGGNSSPHMSATALLQKAAQMGATMSSITSISDSSAMIRPLFIPIRPDKSVVESQVMQKLEFVEHRRTALEKYFRRLVEHPVIKRSEELRLFLQADGKLPLVKTTDVASRMLDGAVKLPWQLFGRESMPAAVDLNEVALPAKGGRDLLRIFKELKQSVTNDWGAAKPPVVEEDKEFLERKDKLQDFENQISNASQQAESLVKAQQDTGETMGQLGLAFVKLTKFEADEALFNSQRVRSADMKSVATAAVKASRLYRELNAQTVKHLDKLHDYLGVMLAVNNAFSERSNALLTVQTLLSELASLNLRIEKLEAASSKIFGGDRSRIRKIDELKETVRVTEDAKDCAVREYERIKENNKNELERLDNEKHDDFLSMLKGFVVNQTGYAEKMASVWEMVAEETSRYAVKDST